MNWIDFFIIVWAAQTVSTLFAMYHHFKAMKCAEEYIDSLKKENRIWGEYSYSCGGLDALKGEYANPPKRDEVLAKIREEKAKCK